MCKTITIEGNGLDLYSYDMIPYFTRLLLTLIKLKNRKKKVHFSQPSLALLYVFPYNISPSRLCFKYTENIRYKNRVRGLCLT